MLPPPWEGDFYPIGKIEVSVLCARNLPQVCNTHSLTLAHTRARFSRCASQPVRTGCVASLFCTHVRRRVASVLRGRVARRCVASLLCTRAACAIPLLQAVALRFSLCPIDPLGVLIPCDGLIPASRCASRWAHWASVRSGSTGPRCTSRWAHWASVRSFLAIAHSFGSLVSPHLSLSGPLLSLSAPLTEASQLSSRKPLSSLH